MLSKLLVPMIAVAIAGAGCSSQQPTAPTMDSMDQAAMLNAARADAPNAASGRHRGDDDLNAVMFMVRIENVSTGSTLHLSNGQTAPAPNSPGVWTVTRLFNPLFTVGQYDAGLGLEQQAEDGNPAVLGANIVNNPWVKSSGIFAIPVGDATPGPATPGKAFEFTVMASPGDRLSFTSMFGQSNDLFYSPGILGIPLFRGHGLPMSGDVTEYVKLWDAGTEVNQEPGLGPDQAPRQSAPNTGESEHKRILAPHDQWTYPATDQVIKVTITPMNANS